MRFFRDLPLYLTILALSAPSAFADNGPHGPGNPGGPGGNPNHPGGAGGPGPRPNPPPAPAPAPAPQPPAPPPPPSGPTQSQIDAARALGQQEGSGAGSREAQERAPNDGRQAGQQAGHQEGFDRCARDMADRAHQDGFAEGYRFGQQEGDAQGRARGQADGNARGQSDGGADGSRRADADSLNASRGPGQAQGVNQANASDAAAKGNADGIGAGDADAKAQAERVDYPRGRKDLNAERQADPVASNDAFNQKALPGAPTPDGSIQSALGGFASSLLESFGIVMPGPGDHGGGGGGNAPQPNANPDNRYNHPARSMPSAQETQAYNEGFASGYGSGFHGTYAGQYQQAYSATFNGASQQGCQEAQSRDYSADRQRGRQEGHDKGYNDAYKAAYDPSYQAGYAAAFRSSSDSAYQASYQADYNRHFEEARAEAYRERYGELYGAALKAAHDAKYAEMYPQYQKAAYERGRADEAADFVQRPVRLLTAEVTETIPNGVMEPGEALRVRLKMRNFATSALLGRDLQVSIQAQNSAGSVISEGQATLVKDLNSQSITVVGEALEFRLNENTVGSDQVFRVNLSYQGRNCGSQVVTVHPRFLTELSFAVAPEVREGLLTNLQLRVHNNGNKPTDSALKIKLQTSSKELEVQQDTALAGAIPAGQDKVVSFPVIGRGQGTTVNSPLVIQALEGSGRRIGLIDGEQSLPVTNDYRVQVRPDTLAGLRNNGLARVEYVVQNISSRILLKGLSLKVTFPGSASGAFVVIGPNPQYLEPVLQGQHVSFLIPVLNNGAGGGGMMQVEIKEDGRTVVIDRNNF